MSLLDDVRQFGHRCAFGRSTLPEFALRICREARLGEIDEDDANDLYATYFAASTGAKVELTTPSVKANASKLRQIIKLGKDAPDAEQLLEKVIEIHDRLIRNESVQSAYSAMVATARERLSTGRRVSEARIVQLMKR